jgi:hypothetical protein
MENKLTDLIADGRLVQVLKDWCPSFPGYFLYYPSRRNQPAALAALIATLRLSETGGPFLPPPSGRDPKGSTGEVITLHQSAGHRLNAPAVAG